MNPEFTAARPDTSIEGALEGNFLFFDPVSESAWRFFVWVGKGVREGNSSNSPQLFFGLSVSFRCFLSVHIYIHT